jgi:hypothetical protein
MLLIILTLSVVGCGGPMSLTDAQIDEVCQHVNDENWHTPVWNHSAQEECRQSRMNIADEQIPCTFGGLPGWCRRISTAGPVIGFHRGISTNWMDISVQELPLVSPHLTVHE